MAVFSFSVPITRWQKAPNYWAYRDLRYRC